MIVKPEFDVFFYHIDEPFAEDHLQLLQQFLPSVKVLNGSQGIVPVFVEMAERSETDNFFSIDADNVVFREFSWNVPGFEPGDRRLHVWRCLNPLTGLVYGHGAVKLWHKDIIRLRPSKVGADFSCSSAQFGFVIQSEVASKLDYFTDSYSIWSQAFKECFKLSIGSTRYFGSGLDPNAKEKLVVWMTKGRDFNDGIFSLHGARLGVCEGHRWLDSGSSNPFEVLKQSRSKFDKIRNIEQESEQLFEELRNYGYFT